MYLKSIDVHGFKSFANKMTFEFHNGITAIVGPNGSGKSNVADAVRWVLGEQRAKQLRGGNMQDVIFSGTETRKPQGFAYVAITLDNSDHKLDVDYEEVTVARRIYRSGESEYLINGASCRLRDIQELFYDTGIGKEGYSIIGQGQIDKILSGKPEERRELFDEAAGIVKFKRRKYTAIKKLEEEKQNLVRVTDILSELTKQLGPLERQAEVAKVYLKKKEVLKTLDVNQYLLEIEGIKKEILKLEESLTITNHDFEETRISFNQAKEAYEKREKDLEKLEETIDVLRNQVNENSLNKQLLENQVMLLDEQIHSTKLNQEHHSNRLTQIKEEKERYEKELENYTGKEVSLEEELKEGEKAQGIIEQEFQQVKESLNACYHKANAYKNQLISILDERSSTKGKLQRYQAMEEQIEIRKASLHQRILSFKSDETNQKELFNKAKEQYEGKEAYIIELKDKITAQESNVGELQEHLLSKQQYFQEVQRAFHRESSKLESLRNLTERYDGYGNSIRRVMEQKVRVPGIKGVVADLLKVTKEYEIAIETALGGSIQNIVTDQEETAKQMIEFLKRNKFGRATFLPLSSMNSRNTLQNHQVLKEEGVLGLACDLVKVAPEYESLSLSLLGRTVVVDEVEHAILIARKYKHSIRMVTLEGELLNTGGSMSGGAFKNNSNLLGRRREIEDLEKIVINQEREVSSVGQQIEELKEQRQTLFQEIKNEKETLQQQLLQQNTTKIKMDNAKTKLDEVVKGFEELNLESSNIDQQLFEIFHNNEVIQLELETSKQAEAKLQDSNLEVQKEIDVLLEQEQALKDKLESGRLVFAKIQQEKTFFDQNKERIYQQIRLLEAEWKEVTLRLEEKKEDIDCKEEEIVKVRRFIEDAKLQLEQDNETLKKKLQEKEENTKDMKAFFDKRDGLSVRMNLLDKEAYRIQNQLEKLEETREHKTNYMWDEYEITPSKALELKEETLGDFKENKRRIQALKEEIKKLGTVNVNAIEDYKSVLERHTFLSEQYEDLIEAQETLLGIIDELDTGMRKQFKEKFEEIRQEFDKAFKELFGGGKGTLELDEDQDLLEAGIKIISQPPGKKLQNMMQLSGGEKALTAIALLFAIQNLKPSPFCLLDEIEAALDDSNVTRYAKYLHKLTKNTQFIIITHRRGSMNAADRLYGITMQEKGVSTLVSVNLIEKDLDK